MAVCSAVLTSLISGSSRQWENQSFYDLLIRLGGGMPSGGSSHHLLVYQAFLKRRIVDSFAGGKNVIT